MPDAPTRVPLWEQHDTEATCLAVCAATEIRAWEGLRSLVKRLRAAHLAAGHEAEVARIDVALRDSLRTRPQSAEEIDAEIARLEALRARR